jgi:hypothetical protein
MNVFNAVGGGGRMQKWRIMEDEDFLYVCVGREVEKRESTHCVWLFELTLTDIDGRECSAAAAGSNVDGERGKSCPIRELARQKSAVQNVTYLKCQLIIWPKSSARLKTKFFIMVWMKMSHIWIISYIIIKNLSNYKFSDRFNFNA